ncbi:transcription repressor NadR [Robertmurraya andreesenii]|uniref:Transcriptional regulator of NAD metabolism n=1 Tax=Anoxybacillus andreesenii TaxID=1325932 RepID=A0ABT9V577_9BACL|nr:transcription repressor NadR [Robertmurraya andreesenii]MDQ0156100.1 transcriptional regulator of NAD metabolism [Robertmurraya andreesenii]
MKGKKILGDERRELILDWLKSSGQPITGSDLAAKTNVSRQVIVSDITLLKAKNEPIIATSQGYLYMSNPVKRIERIVACTHKPEQTEEELLLLVNLGVTVLDVKIEHAVYGDLTASIMVSNPKEVQQFIDKIHSTNASYLSELTNGVHLHTLSAASEEVLDKAEEALRRNGFLIE